MATALDCLEASVGLSSGATATIGRLSREVTLRYFRDSQCLGILTEDNDDILNYMHPLDIPTFHVQMSVSFMKSAARLGTLEFTSR